MNLWNWLRNMKFMNTCHLMCFNYKQQGKMLSLRDFTALANQKLVVLLIPVLSPLCVPWLSVGFDFLRISFFQQQFIHQFMHFCYLETLFRNITQNFFHILVVESLTEKGIRKLALFVLSQGFQRKTQKHIWKLSP